MAQRCKRTINLEYHHVNRGAESVPSNGELLCKDCHEKTETHGEQRTGLPKKTEFPQTHKDEIWKRADGKCECTRENCHNSALGEAIKSLKYDRALLAKGKK